MSEQLKEALNGGKFMKKEKEIWIYRMILAILMIGSIVVLIINGIQMSHEKRIGFFNLTEGKNDEDGVYFKVENQVYQYKPENDLLIELSGTEKTSVLHYIKEVKEKQECNDHWDDFCKQFWGEDYHVTNVICYEDISLLNVSKKVKTKDSVKTENWFYKVCNMDEEPILLTEIVNAPSQAIARFEDKIYYVTDKIGLSNKFVCCDIETGEITELKGYHHNNGMVELIVKEHCMYYTTSPYGYTDGGLMYFNFETGELRLLYSNAKEK